MSSPSASETSSTASSTPTTTSTLHSSPIINITAQGCCPSPLLSPPSSTTASSSRGLRSPRLSLATASQHAHCCATHYDNHLSDNTVISNVSSSPPPIYYNMSRSSKVTRIYYCPEMETLAKAIHEMSPERIELCQIDWAHFPDGWPNIFIHAAAEIKFYHVAFLANIHSPACFFEQFSAIMALPKLLPKSFKLFLPFFPTGTMERVTRLGEVATANSLARMLSCIPSCAKGPAQICIFDIHALQNQFYFRDSVLIRLSTCINLLLHRIKSLPEYSTSELNIAFPDDGASKRFGEMFPSFKSPIICHKVRGEGEKRVVKLKEGDVKDKHVIIVDDLVQSGSTLVECGKELLRNGAKKVSAYVSHAIFPNQSYKKFIRNEDQTTNSDNSIFEYFWITDSNPLVTSNLVGQKPFEVLSIAPLILDIILDETL